jgi:oligoribonuclease NrnB/cAMP/cGMP phosphodiesterase (DHH superfamily)
MIVSITHEHDLDGLGSQAIIKRYFNSINTHENIKYLDAHYNNFMAIIDKTLNSPFPPSQLIITDIGFNSSFISLFNLFESAHKKKCTIIWLDHHVVDEKVKAKLSLLTNKYINDTGKCAAEIVRDYFLPNDPIAIGIADFARDTDFKTEEYQLASDIQLIIGYNSGKKGMKNRQRIVNLLSMGKFQDPWFTTQLKKLHKWNIKESEYALKKAKCFTIENFGDYCISYANMGGGKITQLLKKEHPESKAFIGIDLRHNDIIIYSDFINCRDFAMQFGGGGHIERAGFKYDSLFDSKNIVSFKFIQDVKRSLPKFII